MKKSKILFAFVSIVSLLLTATAFAAVNTEQIVDSAVTTPKIADGAVTAPNLVYFVRMASTCNIH